FKELDDLRLANKEKAEKLIEEAEAQLNNSDSQNSANILIKLQQEWKKIGPTPEKVRDELYRRFKTACDTFYESSRQANKEASKELDEKLTIREAIGQRIVPEPEGDDIATQKLEQLIEEFNAIGFVPRNNIKDIAAKFNRAGEAYVEKLGEGGVDREDSLFRL